MGNSATKSIGDFQANVGTVTSDLSLMVTYIFAGIIILIAIGLAITALIPMKPWDCIDLGALKNNVNFNCDTPPITPGGSPIPLPLDPKACKDAQDAYNNEQDRCNTPVRQTWLLWFLFLIPLAVIIIFVNRWWNHLVHTNKTAAIVQGTGFELQKLQTARNIFSGK